MEAINLYDNFEQNLLTIQMGLKSDIPLYRTSLIDAMPIELIELADVLNQGGAGFSLRTKDISVLDEFIEQYRAQHSKVMEVIKKFLNDKRTTVWVEGIGSLLAKEVVIRRLEYLNEAAALLDTMLVQRRLNNSRTLAAYNDVAPNPNKTYRKRVN